MNVPLRALSWAVRFFWIIALAFAVTGVYSATLIRINFGEPTMTFTEEDFTVTLPIMFDNRGYYNLADLNITTVITDSGGTPISRATTHAARVPPQNNATIYHQVSFNIDEIIANADCLFTDSAFSLYGSIRLDYANLIPFGFGANKTIPWGAPLFNFTAGMPEYSAYNATHLRVDVPISFQNHSPYFSVIGTVRIELFNDSHQLLGEGVVFVDVPPDAAYSGVVETLVNAGLVTARGQIRIYVGTELFDYGPMVIDYG